jgi:hypothetical protein
LTGSPGLIFFNQNDIILVKKTKVNKLQPVFWPGLSGSTGSSGHPGFFLTLFFFNPVRFQPRVSRVPSRPVRPGRVSKLCEKILNRQCLENKSFFASFSNLIHDLSIFIVTETKFLFINFSINLILENFLDTAVIT